MRESPPRRHSSRTNHPTSLPGTSLLTPVGDRGLPEVLTSPNQARRLKSPMAFVWYIDGLAFLAIGLAIICLCRSLRAVSSRPCERGTLSHELKRRPSRMC